MGIINELHCRNVAHVEQSDTCHSIDFIQNERTSYSGLVVPLVQIYSTVTGSFRIDAQICV